MEHQGIDVSDFSEENWTSVFDELEKDLAVFDWLDHNKIPLSVRLRDPETDPFAFISIEWAPHPYRKQIKKIYDIVDLRKWREEFLYTGRFLEELNYEDVTIIKNSLNTANAALSRNKKVKLEHAKR